MIPDISHHDPSSVSSGSCTFISQYCCANVKVHISHRIMRILKSDDNDSAIWIFWLKKRSLSKRRYESCQSDAITTVSPQQLTQLLQAAWRMVANLFLLFNFDENFMCFLYIYVTSPSLRCIHVDSGLTTRGCRVSVWLVAGRCFIWTAGGGSHVLYCLPSHWWLQYRITIHLPEI